MQFFTRFVNATKLLMILSRQYLRKISGQKVIIVIGDSHSLLFQDPMFAIKYIGPATAYKLNSEKSTTKSREQIFRILDSQNSDSKVLLVFGEIDCRLHIYNVHKRTGSPIGKIVASTVEEYVKFIEFLKQKYPMMEFVVCNVFPQGEQANVYNIEHYAGRAVRMEITKKFNKRLEEKCREHNIVFLKVFAQLLDRNEIRKKKFVHDEIHFNNKIVPFIIWELKRKKILN